MSKVDVLRLMYRLIAEEGYSTIKVAEYLNAEVPPPYFKDGRRMKRGKCKVNMAGGHLAARAAEQTCRWRRGSDKTRHTIDARKVYRLTDRYLLLPGNQNYSEEKVAASEVQILGKAKRVWFEF